MSVDTYKYGELVKRIQKEVLKDQQPTTNIKREILNSVNLRLPELVNTLIADPAIRKKYIVIEKPVTFTDKICNLNDISDYKQFELVLKETRYGDIGKIDESELGNAKNITYFQRSIFYAYTSGEYLKLHIGRLINETGLEFKINYLRKVEVLTGNTDEYLDIPRENVPKLFELVSTDLAGETTKEE